MLIYHEYVAGKEFYCFCHIDAKSYVLHDIVGILMMIILLDDIYVMCCHACVVSMEHHMMC